MSKVTMPEALKGKYRFTREITGGPVFDFPAQNLKGVNLNELTESMAEKLLRGKWTGIARVEPQATVKQAPTAGENK